MNSSEVYNISKNVDSLQEVYRRSKKGNRTRSWYRLFYARTDQLIVENELSKMEEEEKNGVKIWKKK